MAAVASARRALARSTKPLVCYAVEQLPAKKGGDALYEQLRTAVASGAIEGASHLRASQPCTGPTLYSMTSGGWARPRTTTTLAKRGGGVLVLPSTYARAAAFGGVGTRDPSLHTAYQ